ncbi:DinB family protein [Deinococcus koreensis]|uniref:DinB superfamily protein n=1 Tax=Deinococcus koreensis TaxID=2054903 RepID=A0A2K3V0Y1_9DEIO|nr:DinB family protein [Deinococcus koreensis]PNY82445.1 DinB superfamily protein [Deinococcus koreensis]
MLPELSTLFARDLTAVIKEMETYPDEATLWRVHGEIINPAGNLALHLIGNLSQFVGDDLGGVPYVRDRAAEFSRRDVPRAELIAGLTHVRTLVHGTLGRLDEARLAEVHPRVLPAFPEGMTSGAFLLHLYGHLNWHLGQIDYHRRLIDSQTP